MSNGGLTAAEEADQTRDKRVNPIRYFQPRPKAVPFFYDDHMIVFLFGGNRASKSYSIVGRNVIALTRIEPLALPGALKHVPEMPAREGMLVRHWCVNKEHAAEEVLLPIYLRYIPSRMLDRTKGENGYNKQKATLYLKPFPGQKRGSRVQFMTYKMEPAAGESASVTINGLDEVPPERTYESQQARIVDSGGVMWGAMTLHERTVSYPIAWVDRRVRRRGDGDHVSWHQLDTEENIRITAAEVGGERGARILQAFKNWTGAMSEEEYDARVRGNPSWLHGLVYKEFDPNIHVYDEAAKCDDEVLRGVKLFAWLAKQQYGHIWVAIDYGIGHPTAYLWGYVAKKPVLSLKLLEDDYVFFAEYKQADRFVHQNVGALNARNQLWGIRPRGYFYDTEMDDRDLKGGLTVKQMYVAAGIKPMIAAKKNKNAGHEAVGKLMRIPKGDGPRQWPQLRFVRGALRMTIEQVLGLCWKPESERGGPGVDKTIDINDDLTDDLRYFVMGQPHLRGHERKFVPEAVDPVTGVPLSVFGLKRAEARA